jgi:ferredoxin
LNTPPVEGSLLLGCTLGPDETVRSGTLRSATPRPKQKNSINLPCLAILKEAHLAALILSGVEEIHLDLTRCSGCSLAKGRDTIDAAVKQARALLDKLGRKDRIKVIDEPPPDEKGAKKGRKGRRAKVKEITPGPEYSRRELFSFLKDKAGEKAQERVFGHGHNPETVAREVGMTERRAVLVGALKGAFEDTDPPARLEEGTFPVHNLGILDKCTMCVRCEAFCPTGAVKTAENDEGEVSIEFRMNLCMGCYECKELCPEGAMYYAGKIELERLLTEGARTLVKRQRVRCTECHKNFYPELHPNGCPGCKRKGALDDRIKSLIFGGAQGEEDTTLPGKGIH